LRRIHGFEFVEVVAVPIHTGEVRVKLGNVRALGEESQNISEPKIGFAGI
jgi:hypothetical protein